MLTTVLWITCGELASLIMGVFAANWWASTRDEKRAAKEVMTYQCQCKHNVVGHEITERTINGEVWQIYGKCQSHVFSIYGDDKGPCACQRYMGLSPYEPWTRVGTT